MILNFQVFFVDHHMKKMWFNYHYSRYEGYYFAVMSLFEWNSIINLIYTFSLEYYLFFQLSGKRIFILITIIKGGISLFLAKIKGFLQYQFELNWFVDICMQFKSIYFSSTNFFCIYQKVVFGITSFYSQYNISSIN